MRRRRSGALSRRRTACAPSASGASSGRTTSPTSLRIRLPYLEAIEQAASRPAGHRPMRSASCAAYADYLGLDGDDIVRRFASRSGSGSQTRPSCTFRAPLPRTRGLPAARSCCCRRRDRRLCRLWRLVLPPGRRAQRDAGRVGRGLPELQLAPLAGPAAASAASITGRGAAAAATSRACGAVAATAAATPAAPAGSRRPRRRIAGSRPFRRPARQVAWRRRRARRPRAGRADCRPGRAWPAITAAPACAAPPGPPPDPGTHR